MAKRRIAGLASVFVFMGAMVLSAATAEKWLHVKVTEGGEDGETVRVNVPLSLAEAILPSINVEQMRNGKINIAGLTDHSHADDVDLRAILEAVRKAPDGEFVTVESKKENVRVAKKAGFMLIEVRDSHGDADRIEKVDVKVPMSVMDAMVTSGAKELDVLAALRALSEYDQGDLVTVQDGHDTVRVWIDSKNTTE